MSTFYSMRAEIPILHRSSKKLHIIEAELSQIIGACNCSFEVELDDNSQAVTVHVSGEMGYSDAIGCDDICKEFYLLDGDQTRVLQIESECDGESQKLLYAPQAVLLAKRISDADRQIAQLTELKLALKTELLSASSMIVEHAEAA